MKPKQIKLLSAGIGAGALIAMGGLGVAFSDASTAEPAPPGRVQPSEITTEQTSTQCEITEATTPAAECAEPSEPTATQATPEITGTPTS